MPYNPDSYAQRELQQGPVEAYWNDSRFGGNTPWQQSIKQYAAIGAPGLSDRPFEGMGKTDISDRLPFQPPAAGRIGQRNPTPEEMGPTSRGLFESFGAGLTTLATELPLGAVRAAGLGSGHIDNFQNLLVNAIGGAGSVFDGVLDFIPVMPFLPGSGDIESQYEQFDDELKVQYDELIATNPQQAMEYMHQYLQLRGADLARKQGVSGMFAMAATPSMDFSEQLSKIVFGGLMAAGDAVARTYVGSGLRDVDNTILNRDITELPDELQELRLRYENKDITRSEFLDELALGQFRWTQDTGFGGFLINTVMDIASDPIIWASFGLGGAAKVGVNPAVRMAAMRTANLAKKAPTSMKMAQELAGRYKLSPEDFLKSERHEHRAAMQEWTRANAPELERQGIQSLNKRQRAAYELRDIITPAAKVANEIDSLFGFFGASKIAPRLRAVRSSNYLEGFVRAAGYKNVKLLQSIFDDFDDFNASLGVASGNSAMVDGQRMAVDDLMKANRAADLNGQSSVVATPEMTPTRKAEIHAEVGLKEAMATEGEQGFLRYREDFIRGTDEASLKASRDGAIESMAQAYHRWTGKSVEQMRRVLSQMDDEGLALAHQVLYGKQVRRFKGAQRSLLESLRAKRDLWGRRAPDSEEFAAVKAELEQAERYTLISENTLTDDGAKALLETIKHDTDAARAAAREAVTKYDQLNINWAKDIRDIEVQRLEMVKHLEALIEDGKTLPHALDSAKLPDEIRNALDPDGRYQIGLAPEDVWGIVRHEDGTVKSVNPFVEVSDGIEVGLSRKVNNWDRMREALFEPITGARIAAKARHNMRQVGAYEFGLTKGEADTFFKAVQAEAIKRNKGMRAWGADELNAIAHDAQVRMPKHIQNRYGERAWLEFTLRSFEGELSMMGLSSRVSSAAKTRAGRAPLGDNILSKIAEDMYPKLRFTLSPMFLAMELTEGPFFAILRGIKPGYRWTEKDIRLNSILRSIAPDYVEIGAGTTRALVAKGDSNVGIRVTERSRFDRAWNKIMPSKFAKPEARIRGPRFYNVYEWKRQMYNRQIAKRMGIDFVEGLKETTEGQKLLGMLESTYNTTDGVELWMRYAEERGMFDPDARHAVHMLDAAKPESLGRERIRIGDVARYMGHDSFADLRKEIHDGLLNEDEFVNRYTSKGLDEAYARRAWKVASGFTVDEFTKELELAVGGVEAAAPAMAWHKTMANAMKMSLDEFLNTQYGDVPQVVSSGRLIPGRAFRQTVEETLVQSDMMFVKRGDDIFDDTLRRSQEALPGTTPELNAAGKANETLSSKARIAGERVRDNNEGIAPTLPPHLKDLSSDNPATRTAAYQAMYDDMLQVFGGSVPELLQASNWYDDVLSVFIGVTHKMPFSAVQRLQKAWDDALEQQIAKASPNEKATLEAMRKDLSGMSEADLRKELAARMHIAFGGSQQNMKVLEGMKRVAGLLEEAVNEKRIDDIIDDLADKHGLSRVEAEDKYRKRYGMEVMVSRLDSMLKDFGNMPPDSLGQKLTDFLDSLAGNTKRTADGGVLGLQPAAMDIWMMRVFGYGDSAYLKYLAKQHARIKGITYEAAEKQVAKDMGWDLDTVRATEPKKPNELQYEWMLHRTNEMKDWLNGELKDKDGNLLPDQKAQPGPNGKWTAAEIQALVWVGLQKKIDYTDSAPVLGLMYDTGAAIVPEAPRRRPRSLSPENTTYSQATAPTWAAVRATLPTKLKDAKKVEGAVFHNKPKVVVDEFDFQGSTRKRYTKYIDNEPVGTVSFRVDENGVAMSHTVVVDEKHRRKGIATQLYEMAEADGFDMVSGARTQSPEGQAFTRTYARGNYQLPPTMPNLEDLRTKYGDEADAVQSSVGYHLTNSLANSIVEELGITPLRTTHGIEGATQTVFATYDQSVQAAARMAIAYDKPVYRVGKGSSHNTFDLVFPEGVTSQQAGPYMAALSEFIQMHLPKVTAKQLEVFEHQLGAPLADGRMALRSVTKKKAPGKTLMSEEGLVQDPIYPVELSPEVAAKLEDGSWVKDIPGNEDIGPDGYVPVTVERNRIAFETITPERGRELVGDDGVATRYSDLGQTEADRAYAAEAPEAFATSGGRAAAAGNGVGAFNQRDGGGAIRAGFLPATAAERAALYFVRNSADASSAIHESFHLFSRHIDQSGKDLLVREYNRVHGLRGKSQKRRYTVEVEEWAAAEFEKFAANDPRPGASYGHIFKAFGEWVDKHPGIEKGGAADDIFHQLLENWADIPKGFGDEDAARIWESTRYALLKAEEEAHSTAYYRRGNNWLMRSMNHPYLGFYPASYMWGKVLPEMTRFLLRKPFGLKAPLGGLQMFSHVYRNIQMQLDTDEELGKFLEDHPDTLRMLTLMVPGMPQEMPVNLPVVARRAMELEAENELKVAQGKEPEPFDAAGWMSDTMSYAVGFTNLADRIGDMAGEWAGDPSDAGAEDQGLMEHFRSLSNGLS